MKRVDIVSRMMNSIWTTKSENIAVKDMTDNDLRMNISKLYAKDLYKEDEPVRKSWINIFEDELKSRGYSWSENIRWWFKKK